MLDGYTEAFSDYLRTGAVDSLAGFCAGDADLRRLGVYRNGFLKACGEALRANYPTVDRIVGADRFPALVRPYVEANPPRSANLAEYGEHFARYIDETCVQHQLGYLSSFAALDRAWSEVYFAADETEGATPTDPPARCAGDTEAFMSLRGRLAPWVRLVSLGYVALDAWSRLREDALDGRTEVPCASQHVLMWRDGANVLFRELSRPELRFIGDFAAGRPCGEAAGAALGLDPDFDLVNSFASLLQHRMLTFDC